MIVNPDFVDVNNSLKKRKYPEKHTKKQNLQKTNEILNTNM